MKKWLLFVPFLYPIFLLAQPRLANQLLGIASIESSQGKYILSASIGEAIVGELVTSSSLLNQGFQQGVSGLQTGSFQLDGATVDLLIYPNPTSQHVTIDLAHPDAVSLELIVHDPLMRSSHKFTVVRGMTTIDVNEWTAGLYYFNFLSREGAVHSEPVLIIH